MATETIRDSIPTTAEPSHSPALEISSEVSVVHQDGTVLLIATKLLSVEGADEATTKLPVYVHLGREDCNDLIRAVQFHRDAAFGVEP